MSGRDEKLRRASNEGHCALSAMLTVSQLSKSFAGRALFDDVSLQVNRGDRINLSPDPLTVRSAVFTFLPYGSDNYFSSDKKTGWLDRTNRGADRSVSR